MRSLSQNCAQGEFLISGGGSLADRELILLTDQIPGNLRFGSILILCLVIDPLGWLCSENHQPLVRVVI